MPTENRSTPFQREDRYIVIKRSDLEKLHPSYKGQFHLELNCISAQMPSRKCLVIESDWPEYEPAWAAIEARVTGKPVEQHQGEPAEVAQLRKECESYKRHTLNAAITIGQICEALGIDDHSEPDMIIEAAKSVADGLNRIVKECPLGTPGFAIACEVLGELGVQQESAYPSAALERQA